MSKNKKIMETVNQKLILKILVYQTVYHQIVHFNHSSGSLQITIYPSICL